MNRYWYRDVNWRNSLLGVLGLCVLLAIGLFAYTKVQESGEPELLNVEPGTSEGTRLDVSYEEPSSARTVNDRFTLTADDTVTVETVTLDGEPAPALTDTEVEPGYTGGGLFEPGDTVYYIYKEDMTISVGTAPEKEFYLDGIASSRIEEFGPEALRLLIRNNEGYLVNYGLFEGKDGQTGAYAVTTRGFDNQHYLTFWLNDGETVVEMTGVIYDTPSIPEHLRSFALVD